MSVTKNQGHTVGVSAEQLLRGQELKERRSRRDFWQQAFLAALPDALHGEWVQGTKELRSVNERTALAADEALRLAIVRKHI